MKAIITAWSVLTFLSVNAQISRPIPETTQPDKIYVFMDKPMYTNSENMYITFFVLNEQNGQYIPSRSSLLYFDILDGRDEVVYKNKAVIFEGAATSSIELGHLKGGQFKIKATTSWNAESIAEPQFSTKTFYIQSADFADMYMQYQLNNDLYFPGDTIRFHFSAKNANNEALRDLFPEFQVIANGELVNIPNATTVELNGDEYSVAVVLRDSFNAESGLIAAAFNYQSQAYSKVYPLIFNSAIGDLSFLPEGGNLLAGVDCNVAFKCIDKSGIGIQVKGMILDENNQMVTDFSSAHRGMGKCRFTPLKNHMYFARILQPVCNKTIALPMVDTMTLFNLEVQRNKDKYEAIVYSKKNAVAAISITRDNENEKRQLVSLKPGVNKVTLQIPNTIPGIAKIRLVYMNAPQSERLVFLYPDKKLRVHYMNASRNLLPGEKNTLQFRVTDEKGNPVYCKFAASVVNEKDMNLVNDKQPNMFASMMLSDELKGNIEDPNWYFVNIDSARFAALDLVMLTHGWRKINPVSPAPQRRERTILAHHYENGNPFFNSSISPVILQTYYRIKSPAALVTYDINFIPEEVTENVYYNHRIQNIYICEDPELRVKYLNLGFQNRESVADTRFANNTLMKAKKVNSESSKPEYSDVEYKGRHKAGSDGEAILGTACIRVTRNHDVIQLVGNSSSVSGSSLLYSAQRGIDGLIARNAAILTTPIGISVRGTRPDGNGTYIDGMRIIEEYANTGLNPLMFGTTVNGPWSATQNGNAAYLKTPVIGENTINLGRTNNSWYSYTGSVGWTTIPHVYSYNHDYNDYYYGFKYYWNETILTMLPRGDRENIWTTSYYKPSYSKYVEPYDRNPISTMWVIPAEKTSKNGLFSIEFQNNYNEAVYRITLEGFGAGMILSDTFYVISKPELSLAWEMPEFVHNGDLFYHKFTIKNHSEKMVGISFQLSGPDTNMSQTLDLNPKEIRNIFIPSHPKSEGWYSWRIMYNSIQENFAKHIRVAPFETQNDIDIASEAQSGSYEFELPSTNAHMIIVKTGNNSESLVKEAQSLIRQPYGCFEQVSSSNYPNLIVYEFLKNSGMLESSKEALTNNIKMGLNALQKYKTAEGGYEWFGHTPPHQALTAYGLIQFYTASKLGLLSADVVKETQDWLVSQQKEDGNFINNTGKYDHFANIPDNVSNAYITYALARSGYPKLNQSIQNISNNLDKNFDPYIASLLYQIYLFENSTTEADQIQIKIEKYLEENADRSNLKMHTITNSTGYSGAMEMLCIYGMGLLQNKNHSQECNQILAEVRKMKIHISTYQTQANALFFEFLAKYMEQAKPDTASKNQESKLFVNGFQVQALNANSFTQVIQIPEDYLRSGKNYFQITGNSRTSFFKAATSFSYAGFYYKDTGYYSIKNNWMKTDLQSGESNVYHLEIANHLLRERGQTVACIYFPDGMQPGPEILGSLMKQKKFDYYEIQGNCLTLYFLKFQPGETKTIDFGVSCLFPGEFHILPPKVFAFYEDKNLNSGEICKISIRP